MNGLWTLADIQGIGGPGISSLYLQYKADTSKLHNWICQTALEHGFPRKRLGPYVLDAKGQTQASMVATAPLLSKSQRKRMKKARAAARREATPTATNDVTKTEQEDMTLSFDATPDRPNRYRITAQLHTEMVKHIAQKGVLIPCEVVLRLDRCIRLRVRSAKSLSRFGKIATADMIILSDFSWRPAPSSNLNSPRHKLASHLQIRNGPSRCTTNSKHCPGRCPKTSPIYTCPA